MTQLSWNEIQDRATEFASKWEGETYEKGESQPFWGEFLNIFGIDRRRHGAFFEYAIKKGSGKQGFIDMFWPGKLLAEQKSGGKDLSKAGIQAYEYLETMPDHDLPHAIVLSDFASFVFLLNDGNNEKIEFKLNDLPKQVKLFGFLINQESKHLVEENPVNRKAAEAMASLHNQLRDDNYTGHDLEVLLVRLVFCLFADDSGIFDRHILEDYIVNRTNEDGSDLGPRLMQIFQALNTPLDKRQNALDEAIVSFPYVNGGLFADSITTPSFTAAMRRELLATMQLDWSQVSPAIFGSMFQGVMDEKQRRNLGAHYTSEKNILRVIKPLFLDDLYDEFATALNAGPRKKFEELRKFQDKLASLKFLDPACGCGNFLVITYRELRKLEHKVVAVLSKGEQTVDMFATAGKGVSAIKVNVDQMYGIEIEEFPSLIAQTALWLTDHQMNVEFSRQSGHTFKRLPLTHSATIVNDNALTKDWAEVIAPKRLNYILGNPPFSGKSNQTSEQKQDILKVAGSIRNASDLDFVAAWYIKCAQFIADEPIKVALVSTNSICQGEQAGILWPYMFANGIIINFAYQTFKWSNDARGNAAVHCVIIGFSKNSLQAKRYIYTDIDGDPSATQVSSISPYLTEGPSFAVIKATKPLNASAPIMRYGNKPSDNGNLILSDDERADLLREHPDAEQFIKRFVGAQEVINGGGRWCLWFNTAPPNVVRSIPTIMQRLERVKAFRAASTSPSTRQTAVTPYFFFYRSHPNANYLVIPETSSENREYIPIAYIDASTISSNSCYMIPTDDKYIFSILTSRMHMAWMRTIAGRLKSDYRYTGSLIYNTFPWPEVTSEQKIEIENLAQNILDARAQFPNSSLADLYDPLTMPPELSKAHKALDHAIDKLYQSKPFDSDAERVALLFGRYQEMTG
jgi:hypothetical protein